MHLCGTVLLLAACLAGLVDLALAAQLRASNPHNPALRQSVRSGATKGQTTVSLSLSDYPSPQFTVDLALAPADRWDAAVRGVVQQGGWNSTYGRVFEWIHSIVPQSVLEDISPLFTDLLQYLGDYGEEMQGIWSTLQDINPDVKNEFTFGSLIAMNFIYDLSAFCTSIVAQHANGTMYHARNLDYPVDGLNGITATVSFVNSSGVAPGSNAPVLYHGTSFIGYVGLLTGMRPGVFSVSVNQRTVNASEPLKAFLENIESALSGGQSIGMFLRRALQEETNFQNALQRLNSTKLIAPVYLTVAGTTAGQGAVITRNRDHADLSHGLAAGIWSLASPPPSWFRLETNYDHWAPAGDKRRATAYAEMNKLSSAVIDGAALFRVLSTPPVLNGDTRYTAVMSAATGEYYTVTRSGDAPGHLVAGPKGWFVEMPDEEGL